MKKKIFPALFASAGMLMLILDSKVALAGANQGVELCIRSVVPSLFPFLVLSTVLTASLGSGLKILRPLCRITGIPEGGESLLIVGFLGGYPVGAQTVGQLYRQGRLSKYTAKRLLMFCSNAGPAFLFGIVGPQFSSVLAPWLLFGITVFSALAVGILVPGKKMECMECSAKSISLSEAVGNAVSVMGRICGWVVLFRILTAFLDRWILWLLPEEMSCLIAGLLELTIGCCNLTVISDESLRFIITAILMNFGGLCVWLQTVSVTEDLGTAAYLKGKLLQTVFAATLSWILIRRDLWGISLVVLVAVCCTEAKKRCSNSAALGV